MTGKLLVIAGPTASGKSSLALRLAEELHGEIINADSQQVYRGLDIGTGKPDAAERARVPHHLYDIADPWEQLDASKYVALADAAVAEVLARGRLPIIVGGTGLWIRALLRGLVDAPPRNEAFRKELELQIETHGLASLHDRLHAIDPESADRIHTNDPVRMIRALEVFEAGGISQTELHRRHALGAPRYDAVRVALDTTMEALEVRIRRRVTQMFDHGLIAETLRAWADPRTHDRLARVMGYREVLEFQDGTLTHDEAVAAIVLAQRQYAKRQRTWFRGEPEWTWIPAQDGVSEALAVWQAA